MSYARSTISRTQSPIDGGREATVGSTRQRRYGFGAAILLVGATLAGGLAPAHASAATVSAASVSAASVPAVRAQCVPGPVLPDLPWPQRMLAPQQVWEHATGRGITVAVIDSGVDTAHPQLRDSVLPGQNYLADNGVCTAHGTEVASIIGARRATGVGFQGLAPDAKILPIRVSDRDAQGEGDAVDAGTFAEAIRFATTRAQVINISLVMRDPDARVEAAVAAAIAANVVVVAAVGNGHNTSNTNGVDPPSYPAAYPNVIGVGAINSDGSALSQSQVGSYVDIVAPGGNVIAATPAGGHAQVTGTSFATPFVAATAALVRQARPGLKATEVANRILGTATPSRGGLAYGNGVVNPYRAVTEVMFTQQRADLPSAPPAFADAGGPARLARWQSLRRQSLAIGAGTVGLVAAIGMGVWVYRRGTYRRWRPGRAAAVSTPPRD